MQKDKKKFLFYLFLLGLIPAVLIFLLMFYTPVSHGYGEGNLAGWIVLLVLALTLVIVLLICIVSIQRRQIESLEQELMRHRLDSEQHTEAREKKLLGEYGRRIDRLERDLQTLNRQIGATKE